MNQLLSCQSIGKTFGTRKLFEDVSLGIFEGDRIGLIGPNGSGKSTLLKILAGLEQPDSGDRALRKWTQLGYISQVSEFAPDKSVRQILTDSLKDTIADEQERMVQVEITLSKVGFPDGDQVVGTLSGGWKKRLGIAEALVHSPDVLLLDEPTNHLDLEGILWLEEYLKSAQQSFLLVSHDRVFLENVATRMMELNAVFPGGLFTCKGNYSEFLLKKEEFLQGQLHLQESLASKVRREVEWLHRGPKARTTKARFRIEQAGRLIEELGEVKSRNNADRRTDIDFTSSERKSKELVSARGMSKKMGDKQLFQDLNFVISPGQCLGLVGPNGSGKTTLIRLLMNELEPDQGELKRAEGLRVVHFAQDREELDLNQTLKQALSPDGDHVSFRDQSLHVASWARRFLFHTDQLGMQVSLLSGGERARILIARLMLRPADLLILDEPTNDLDLPTLEVLEENLLDFSGALVLVTHDRYMLDRVSTKLLGLDGEGNSAFFADYQQWETYRKEQRKSSKKSKKSVQETSSSPEKPKRLSYMEKREWEEMENKIMEFESQIEEHQAMMLTHEVASDAQRLQEVYDLLQKAQSDVEKLYARWAELEEKIS